MVTSDSRQCPVIVVHGLWVHGLVMGYLAHRISGCGFTASTWSYPSMRMTLTENAERFARHCEGLAATQGLHIVAHSMGGLVALKMLELVPSISCERLLLLGTPYTDSVAARRLAGFPGGDLLLGRSIAQWLNEPRPGIRAESVGVISGTRGLGLGALIAPDLPQPNDGVVAREETMLPLDVPRIDLPVSHSEMLFSSEVARQCCTFLKYGRFEAKVR